MDIKRAIKCLLETFNYVSGVNTGLKVKVAFLETC